MVIPKHGAKTDDNEKDIIAALKKIGCTVERIGRPVDLLVGFRKRNYLIECKNTEGRNTLTQAQKKFIPAWQGQVRIVHTPDEAIQLVTRAYGREG